MRSWVSTGLYSAAANFVNCANRLRHGNRMNSVSRRYCMLSFINFKTMMLKIPQYRGAKDYERV